MMPLAKPARRFNTVRLPICLSAPVISGSAEKSGVKFSQQSILVSLLEENFVAHRLAIPPQGGITLEPSRQSKYNKHCKSPMAISTRSVFCWTSQATQLAADRFMFRLLCSPRQPIIEIGRDLNGRSIHGRSPCDHANPNLRSLQLNQSKRSGHERL